MLMGEKRVEGNILQIESGQYSNVNNIHLISSNTRLKLHWFHRPRQLPLQVHFWIFTRVIWTSEAVSELIEAGIVFLD